MRVWEVAAACCVRQLSLALGWVAWLSACPGGGMLAAGAEGGATLLRVADVVPEASGVLQTVPGATPHALASLTLASRGSPGGARTPAGHAYGRSGWRVGRSPSPAPLSPLPPLAPTGVPSAVTAPSFALSHGLCGMLPLWASLSVAEWAA